MELIFVLIGIVIGVIVNTVIEKMCNPSVGVIKVNSYGDDLELYLLLNSKDDIESIRKSHQVTMKVEHL